MSDDAAVKEIQRQALAILVGRCRKAARVLSAAVRAAAPSGTGQLKASIKSKTRVGHDSITMSVYAGRFARFLEWGVRNRKRKDGKPSRSGKEWRIEPSMWVKKSFLAAIPEAMNILENG